MLFQTCMSFFMLNIKYILENFEELNNCWSPLTSIVGKEILWNSIETINCLITSILQNIFFNVHHKKETHDDKIFIFGWTIPLTQKKKIRVASDTAALQPT